MKQIGSALGNYNLYSVSKRVPVEKLIVMCLRHFVSIEKS